jgi:demethylmenaquinone methyltransferase/2-methoxy-6-polyprenyl-1,4-benzoquinol methylase
VVFGCYSGEHGHHREEVRMDESSPHDLDGVTRRLFAPLPARYDRLAALLSLGQDARWRRAMVDQVVRPTAVRHAPDDDPAPDAGDGAPVRILDVACGPAGVTLQLARRSGAAIVGIDLSEEMLDRGRRNVVEAGLASRVQLVRGRAQRLPFPDATFDAVTFTYLLRYVEDPQSTLTEMARVLRPGGAMASLEFLVPPEPFWRFWWWGYTRLVLPVAGGLTGGPGWFRVGRFLGPSISTHYRRYPVDWTVRAWELAGLEDVRARPMSLGGGLVMWGNRAGG